MSHSSVYEDLLVDQSVRHTMALVFSFETTRDTVLDVRERLACSGSSHISSDDHITNALLQIMALSEDPSIILDDDPKLEAALMFVDCDDIEEFKQQYFMLRLTHEDQLIGCLHFDREQRIAIGALYEEVQTLVTEFEYSEALIDTEEDTDDLWETRCLIREALESLSPKATQLIDRIKLCP